MREDISITGSKEADGKTDVYERNLKNYTVTTANKVKRSQYNGSCGRWASWIKDDDQALTYQREAMGMRVRHGYSSERKDFTWERGWISGDK
jgi:hypothetical protein